MNIKLTCVLIATLGSSVLAQNYMITPPTGTTLEGEDSSFIFGWAATQANRFMDNTHTGTKRSLKGVAFRADYRNHNAIGRTWSKITVQAAHGDYSSAQYKSSAYTLKDTPTKVFDAKWSFPALKGNPVLQPASWGGVAGSLNFRFSSPWAYNGNDAIFLEFGFSGGVADNNVKWEGAAPKGFEYFLDSMPQKAWETGSNSQRFGSKAYCYDSAFRKSGKGKGAPAYLDATLSSGTKVELGIKSYYTSQKSLVVYAVGLAGNPQGLNIGAECNLLYVDFTSPVALFFLPTPNNSTAYASLTLRTKPAAWIKEAWVQAAWADSATQNFKLTDAVRPLISTGPPPAFKTSYTTPQFSIWNQAPKGLPYTRYEY